MRHMTLCPHTFSHHYFSIKGPVLTAAVSFQADVDCDGSLNLKTKLFLWTICLVMSLLRVLQTINDFC